MLPNFGGWWAGNSSVVSQQQATDLPYPASTLESIRYFDKSMLFGIKIFCIAGSQFDLVFLC
jgi:hypothetical protein